MLMASSEMAEKALDFSTKKPSLQTASLETAVGLSDSSGRTSSISSHQSSPRSAQSPSSTTICEKLATPTGLGIPFGSLGLLNPSMANSPLSMAAFGPKFGPFGPTSFLDQAFSPTGISHLGSGALRSPPAWMSSVSSPNILPDPAFFPTASLAMSTLHRRRRRSSTRGSSGEVKVEDPQGPVPDDGEEFGESAKRAKQVPTEQKDEAYWERRKRNNEAAKRSRDARRAKEEEIAMRATGLEQENLKLRAQVAILKNETAKLHLMLFSNAQHHLSFPAPAGSASALH